MPRTATPAPEKKPAVGCAHCWAAKYCAAYSALPSPQPPTNCPLLPPPPRAPGGRK